MNKKNQDKLFALAPEWFDKNHPMDSLMCFGFEVGNGWYELLKELILDLKKIETPDDFSVVQVKEKFGTLCFYISGWCKEAEDRIAKAEDKSATICENCGNPGFIGGHEWIRVRCEDCNNKGN